VSDIEAIITASDAIMVARGDLGVELPAEDVPIVQKTIVSLCNRLGRPVIVATQMLESMISAPAPTRAEASDVATAVFDGADAVMLSAETAAGQFPMEAVDIMGRILARVEGSAVWRLHGEERVGAADRSPGDAIAVSARQIAQTIGAKAIVAYTLSGASALRIARQRSEAPVLALTPSAETARRLALAWGVEATVTARGQQMSDAVSLAAQTARRAVSAKIGDYFVVVAGVPFGKGGTTNTLRIGTIGGTVD
jgi:pyruvate kinase